MTVVDAAPVPTRSDARRIALRIAEEPLVERVLLLGSVARGEATPGSDFDLVVLLSDATADDGRHQTASRRERPQRPPRAQWLA